MEAFEINHSGRTVHGFLFQPDGEGPFPGVVLSHGYNGCMTDFVPTAQYLAQRGIACATFTFCGGSTRDESGFPTTQMTLFTQRQDLLAVLDMLRRHPKVDPEQVYLFGGSMGALVSVLAAVVSAEAVAGLMLLYPALCVPDNWRERFPRVEDIPETVDFWGMTLGETFFRAMRDLDVYALLPGLNLPVRIAQGDMDPIATHGDSARALQLLPRAQMHLFRGEAHGFSPKAQREVDRILEEFIREKGRVTPGLVTEFPQLQ